MGVPGKPGQVLLRDVVAEVIEEEERVELGGVTETERTAQVNARAFKSRLCLNNSLDRSK
jgi:hypothetical protein